MYTTRQLLISFLLVFITLSLAQAQDKSSPGASGSAPAITVAGSADRVRFTSPNSVVQVHLQVYDNAGQLVFDVSSKGNVLDWTLQDSGGQRLNPGSYLSVVTVKSLSGKLSQRIGSVSVGEKQLELQRVEGGQMTLAQQQAIGPIEENGALTILQAGETEAATVVAHDGTQGEITRSRGALSFRLGDFFSGKDEEQMRLTEAGNLGIGTDSPQAKLDVAGAIRTSKGIEFASGTDGTNITKLTTTATGSLQQILPDGTVVPNATGTGTQNKIAKWTDNAGTLGDSVVTEASGNIGIGTSSPQAALHVIGNQFLKPVGATPTYKVLAGSDPTSTVMLTTDSSAFGWQIAPSNAQNDTIVQVLGQSFASVPNRGEFGIYLGTDGNSAFKVVQRGGPELMRVTRTGNLGIGNPTPGAKLDVTGNINTSTQYNIAGNRILSAPGSNNAFVGFEAGKLNSTGAKNSFFGQGAGFSNSTGGENSFFGFEAGIDNGTGQENSFFGSEAGFFNAEGAFNSFVGYQAGHSNTTGGRNSFFGFNAGNINVDGVRNTAIGNAANVGASNLTNATAIGSQDQVDQSDSLVLGTINGVNGATANTKVGIGVTAPSATLTVASLTSSLSENTATFRNFGIGPNQSHVHYGLNGDWYIRSAASGGYVVLQDTGGNVGIGTATPKQKLHVRTGADENVVIGRFGDGSGPFIASEDDSGSVSGRRLTLASDTVVLNVRVAIGTNNADRTLTVNGGADKLGGGSWDTFSDERLKNIKGRFTPGIKALMQLQPLRYEYKPDNALGLKPSGEYIGFGAQAVQKIIPEAVSKNDKGYLLVNNDPILWTMLNAIKEQQQQLQQKRAHIEKLEARLAALEMMVKKISVKQRPRR
jgi:hypothetical protein